MNLTIMAQEHGPRDGDADRRRPAVTVLGKEIDRQRPGARIRGEETAGRAARRRDRRRSLGLAVYYHRAAGGVQAIRRRLSARSSWTNEPANKAFDGWSPLLQILRPGAPQQHARAAASQVFNYHFRRNGERRGVAGQPLASYRRDDK